VGSGRDEVARITTWRRWTLIPFELSKRLQQLLAALSMIAISVFFHFSNVSLKSFCHPATL
jgi:hypothetical protein